MMWQDWVFGIGTIIFSMALLPAIFGKDKPPVATSLSTGAVLLLFAVAQGSLSLWFASTMSVIAGILWLTLAVQKYRQAKSASASK